MLNDEEANDDDEEEEQRAFALKLTTVINWLPATEAAMATPGRLVRLTEAVDTLDGCDESSHHLRPPLAGTYDGSDADGDVAITFPSLSTSRMSWIDGRDFKKFEIAAHFDQG